MPQSPDHSSTEPDPNRPDQPAMPTEREKFPAHFRFSHRYGYEPLPEPMQPEYLSNDLRIELCDAVENYNQQFEFLKFFPELPTNSPMSALHLSALYQAFCRSLGYPDPNSPEDIEMKKNRYEMKKKRYEIKKKRYEKYHGRILRKIGKSKILRDNENIDHIYSSILTGENFYKVLDFIEIIINKSWEMEFISKDKITNFAEEINELFDKYNATYQLNTSQHPYWFFPVASKEQGEITQEAIKALHQRKMNNATDHLRQAAEHMKMNQYGDSVADSIHAVESVAGEVDPKSNKTLGKALDSLEREGLLQNSLLKEALKKLHGYANQPGIRHGQQEGSTVNVGLDEAILMYGACASFAAYLTQKHQHSMP